MARTRIDYQETAGNTKSEAEISFKCRTSENEKGEIVYYAPVEVKSKEDLRCLGIQWGDCKTLHFGRSERLTVYYYPTTNKAFADMQWAELNTRHSRMYRSTRCLVPGKVKAQIVCPDTNKCSACPYHRKPEDRQTPEISWDEIIKTGYEPVSDDKNLRAFLAWMEFESIKKMMDAKDPNIARAIILKVLYNYNVQEIAESLQITVRQVYYCLQQAKQIGMLYKRNNPD